MTQTPRGIRNNNPGNIRHGQKWQGLDAKGREKDPAFCVFTETVWGIRALAKLLVNYKKLHKLKTTRSIISRYAPPEENQTLAYINSVSRQLGVYPDTEINIEEAGVLAVFVKAIIRFENGIQPYSNELIKEALEKL